MIIISRSNSKLGHVGSKTRSLGQILINIVHTQKGTVLIQTGSNTRSVGQILEKNIVYILEGKVLIQNS